MSISSFIRFLRRAPDPFVVSHKLAVLYLRPWAEPLFLPPAWLIFWLRIVEMLVAALFLIFLVYGLTHPGYWTGLDFATSANVPFQPG